MLASREAAVRDVTFAGVRRLATGICLLVVGSGCATSHPENPALDAYPPGIVGSTDVVYYDVHGRTARELVDDMRRLGPQNGRFFGEAQSPLRWTWRTKSDGPNCRTSSANVVVRSEITLPRWTPAADTAPGVYAQWKTFLSALETHEVGHKDISARHAREMLTALQKLTGFCSSLDTERRRITDDILARMHEEQIKYDADTRHGVTQGAVFPARPTSPPRIAPS
jgi:predicted secreted Zn-dependent protease